MEFSEIEKEITQNVEKGIYFTEVEIMKRLLIENDGKLTPAMEKLKNEYNLHMGQCEKCKKWFMASQLFFSGYNDNLRGVAGFKTGYVLCKDTCMKKYNSWMNVEAVKKFFNE